MKITDTVTGKTKLLGVIGDPLEHSISPKLHNTLNRCLGIDAVYVPFHTKKGQFEHAINGLLAINVYGFNVTIPYKNDVINYIHTISKKAALIGAVNTVKNVNGRLYGYNTDADGFIKSFMEETGMEPGGKKVVIFGAGGAARAIAVGLALRDASKISIINRTVTNGYNIVRMLSNNTDVISECFSTDDPECCQVIKRGDIIINTTPLGMYPKIDSSPISFPFEFSSNQILYDAIYNPSSTKFIQEGKKQGLKTVNGLGMLIYQGVRAYEIWMGVKVESKIIEKLFNIFQNLDNII